MRAFIARLYDLTVLLQHQAYLSFPPPPQGIYPGSFGGNPFYAARFTYWQENRHSFNVIARRTGFASGAAAMTNYSSGEPHGFITVGSAEAAGLMDGVAQWMDIQCP